MTDVKRPPAFWVIVAFLAVSLVMLLVGQTGGLIDYGWAVDLGLQESVDEIGEYGKQVGRSFGGGDTVVYVPLMAVSLIGLLLRRRWSLFTAAAVMGISTYWTATVLFMLALLPGVPTYELTPGPGYLVPVSLYFVVGVWGLLYLIIRGDRLTA